MAWDTAAKYLEDLERKTDAAWPPEWEALQGEILRSKLLTDEVRLRPLIDTAIRESITRRRWSALSPMESWFLHQRIILARKFSHDYAMKNEPVPSQVDPDRLPILMLVNFWNEMGAELARERWKRIDVGGDTEAWSLSHLF